MSYDMIDRFLRNNLDDDDYAEYSAALDELCAPPAQRTWVGLTDEEIVKMIPNDPAWNNEVGEDSAVEFARAIEAAHGITAAPQLKENT